MKTCPACDLVFPDESTFCFLGGHTLETTSDPLVGSSLAGRFRIVDMVSQTGWSKVFSARYRLLVEPCMVKTFQGDLDEQGRERFLAAYAHARRCTHPNVTPVIGGGITPAGVAYLAHAKRDAQPLMRVLVNGPLAVDKALGITKQLLAALARIHDFGAVHGGLRPSNILVSEAGHAEMIDIGLGRVLFREPWQDDAGSLQAQFYTAPELNSQERQSVAADLFSLGATCFHMITGQPPVTAANVAELRTKLADDNTEPLRQGIANLPEPITEWMRSLLHRLPQERTDNAHQAYEELLEACELAGIAPVEDPAPPEPPPKPTLDRSFARWGRFTQMFIKMLEVGFPQGPPAASNDALQAIRGRLQQLDEVAKQAAYQHGVQSDVLDRAHDGRHDIASQMEALNVTAKAVRKEVQPLKLAAKAHAEKALAFPDEALEKHRDVIHWEGRSAFMEPYQELATAYKTLADVFDRWFEVRAAQLRCEQDVASKEEQLIHGRAELEELRTALRIHESNLSAELDATEGTLGELGDNADKLELELVDLASRYCAPLRAKPELGACFRELEKLV